jgi:hypothetical protein
MLLAAASGLLLTLYSALYKMVKKDIDNSTVLMLRGIIQVRTLVQRHSIVAYNIAYYCVELS